MTCKHNWQFTDGGTGTLLCTRCGAVTGPRTPEQLTQDMLQDVTVMGSAWSKDGERIDPLSVYRDTEPVYKLHDSRPTNSIQFFNNVNNGPSVEVLRISKDGIWANPDIPTDEAAKKVLEAIDGYVKGMVERALEDDTGVSWGVDWGRAGDKACVSIIKRLPNGKIKVLAVEYQP
jgi:hypothetical protein